jgi:hypothetical protein
VVPFGTNGPLAGYLGYFSSHLAPLKKKKEKRKEFISLVIEQKKRKRENRNIKRRERTKKKEGMFIVFFPQRLQDEIFGYYKSV